jgi:hypothetical protein
VVIYERPTTDRIQRIRQVVEAPAPRWTFEVGMREAAREAWVVLCHEADGQMDIRNTATSQADLKKEQKP